MTTTEVPDLRDYVGNCPWGHSIFERQWHWVYALLGVDGEVLYVGRTMHLALRIRTHRRKAPWWPEVADLVSTRTCCVDRASRAEIRAMRELRAIHNVDPRENARRGHETRRGREAQRTA